MLGAKKLGQLWWNISDVQHMCCWSKNQVFDGSSCLYSWETLADCSVKVARWWNVWWGIQAYTESYTIEYTLFLSNTIINNLIILSISKFWQDKPKNCTVQQEHCKTDISTWCKKLTKDCHRQKCLFQNPFKQSVDSRKRSTLFRLLLNFITYELLTVQWALNEVRSHSY